MYYDETATERVTRRCARSVRIDALRHLLRSDTGDERTANQAELEALETAAREEDEWLRTSRRRPGDPL